MVHADARPSKRSLYPTSSPAPPSSSPTSAWPSSISPTDTYSTLCTMAARVGIDTLSRCATASFPPISTSASTPPSSHAWPPKPSASSSSLCIRIALPTAPAKGARRKRKHGATAGTDGGRGAFAAAATAATAAIETVVADVDDETAAQIRLYYAALGSMDAVHMPLRDSWLEYAASGDGDKQLAVGLAVAAGDNPLHPDWLVLVLELEGARRGQATWMRTPFAAAKETADVRALVDDFSNMCLHHIGHCTAAVVDELVAMLSSGGELAAAAALGFRGDTDGVAEDDDVDDDNDDDNDDSTDHADGGENGIDGDDDGDDDPWDDAYACRFCLAPGLEAYRPVLALALEARQRATAPAPL